MCFSAELSLPQLFTGNHSPTGLPHQQSPNSGRLPADRGLLLVSTLYLKILLWVSIILTSLGAGTFRSGGVCILNQAVYSCTQAGLHYSCLLQPLRSLEVVGASGAANFVAQRTNSLISHATIFCLCNSSKSCLLIPQRQRTQCTALYYTTSITRNSQGFTCLDLR